MLVRRIMKKPFVYAAAFFTAIGVLSSNVSAVQGRVYPEKYWKEYIRLWNEGAETALEKHIDRYAEDDATPRTWLDTAYFTSETNYIIKVKICMREAVGNEDYDDHYMFYFVLNDGTEYIDAKYNSENALHGRTRSCCTTAEILARSEIPDTDMIFKSAIFYNNGYDPDADLESINFYPCTGGWNTIDGEQYYVKSDGCLATKSMVIDGVRYKFGKSGICEGKYTGWTKSSKGRRYWKNGVLMKNKTLRTKSGKLYKLDRNGYVK